MRCEKNRCDEPTFAPASVLGLNLLCRGRGRVVRGSTTKLMFNSISSTEIGQMSHLKYNPLSVFSVQYKGFLHWESYCGIT